MPVLLAAAAAVSKVLPKVPVPIATGLPNTKGPGASLAPNAIAAPQAMTWFQLHMAWFTHGIAILGILAAITLIVLLAVQTTKQEGLSGSIGGRVESAYKGRPGAEEQLTRVTGFVVGVFLVSFVILSLTGI